MESLYHSVDQAISKIGSSTSPPIRLTIQNVQAAKSIMVSTLLGTILPSLSLLLTFKILGHFIEMLKFMWQVTVWEVLLHLSQFPTLSRPSETLEFWLLSVSLVLEIKLFLPILLQFNNVIELYTIQILFLTFPLQLWTSTIKEMKFGMIKPWNHTKSAHLNQTVAVTPWAQATMELLTILWTSILPSPEVSSTQSLNRWLNLSKLLNWNWESEIPTSKCNQNDLSEYYQSIYHILI